MEQKNILIVEDEAIVALKIKSDLIKIGQNVAGICASGEDALETVKASKPDLILMDIQLQGDMDGIMTAEKVLKEFDVPVVFLTAHSDSDTIRKAMDIVPYGYLLKPVAIQELMVTIQVALYKHKADREKEELLRQLRQALDEVKTLKGFLPICASCKKIRNDKGYWDDLEDYISKHSEAQFSHGICPDCMKRIYSDINDKK